ncbi:MAG TPA: hypothetical protein VGD16_04665 [Enterovirga sp.]
MSRPETAALRSGTTARITAAASTMYPCDAWLAGGDACAEERLDEAAGEDFEAPATIADAVMVVVRGQRRDFR